MFGTQLKLGPNKLVLSRPLVPTRYESVTSKTGASLEGQDIHLISSS